MSPTGYLIRRALLVGVFAFGATLLAQAQAGPNGEGRKAEETYRNIQVLRGTLASELNQSMHLIESQTGMDCTYCHVEGAFEKDDKPAKQVARRMIVMMNAINAANFGGRQMVTCYTCHNGRPIPSTVPSFPISKPVLADPDPAALGPKIVLPAVDEILTKYVDALGGEAALRKVSTRIVTGTQYIPSGPGGQVPVPAALERLQKAPNLVVNNYKTPTYTVADGFDGTKAWSVNAQGRVTEPASIDQGRAKRDADFYLPLHLKEQYTQMEVTGVENVNGSDAYRVVGTVQGDLPERLYFDVLSGLLVRKETALPTPAGQSPFRVDYADYQDTSSGVKFPFLITMTPATARSVLFTTAVVRITKVQDNAPIDDARFARPAPRPAPAR